jgi:hypothetical protein
MPVIDDCWQGCATLTEISRRMETIPSESTLADYIGKRIEI